MHQGRTSRVLWPLALTLLLWLVTCALVAQEGDDEDIPDLPPAKITCESTPPGAAIWVGHPSARPEWRKGDTPMEITIDSSSAFTPMDFRVTFILPGYDEAYGVFTVLRGEEHAFTADLERTCKVAFIESGYLVAQGFDGTHRRQLAYLGPDAAELGDRLSWSPTGRALAYVANGEVFTVSLDGPPAPVQLTRVTDQGAFACDSPMWSPDGWSVAYRKLGLTNGRATLCVTPLGQPGEETALATNVAYAGEWLPKLDPRRIATEASDGVLIIDMRPYSNLVLSSRKIEDAGQPTWSPDGLRLAFVKGGQLCIADDMGGNPVPMTQLREGRALSPRWSQDGLAVAFLVRSRAASGQEYDDIYLLDIDSGQPAARIGPRAGDPGSGRCLELVGFGPDGGTVLYQVRGAARPAVWELQPSTGASRLALKDARLPAWFACLPDVRERNFALFRQRLLDAIDTVSIPDAVDLLSDPVITADSNGVETPVTGDARRTLAARICQDLQPMMEALVITPVEDGPASTRMVMLTPPPAGRLYFRLEEHGWRIAYVLFQPEG